MALGWLLARSRSTKQALLVFGDAVVVPVCLWFTLLLRYESVAAADQEPALIYVLSSVAAVTSFLTVGLYRAVTRYVGFRFLAAVLGGAFLTATAVWLGVGLFADKWMSPAVATIFMLNVIVWISSTRLLARWLLTLNLDSRERAIIYGAGEAGARLAMLVRAGSRNRPAAYIDDKRQLQNTTVQGIPVFPPEELPELMKHFGTRTVLLAIPAASRSRRAEVIRQLADAGARVQTVPDLHEILSGRAQLTDLRDVSIGDLLGRDSVTARSNLLQANIRDKNVLVTGAGGSIGSELCRQILDQRPKRLVLLELSEYGLYNIWRELSSSESSAAVGVEIVGLLGNTQHQRRLQGIMRSFDIHTVYHAAAYKHVPIVEENIIEGIYNNVFATWNAAEAAAETGVETFVLVSTDKAVRPSSVMGATKRFAEIVLQGMATRQTKTRFCMVRFGNVLGSSGSVVPLFQEQIRSGGPVTITHPEVRRYFMTIPEAASLVIQAGAMARGGDVFLLDMGKPVRIEELARRMVALSGLTVRDAEHPNGDIEIKYTGLRPAEKLYEELLIDANAAGTEHPMILRATEGEYRWDEVSLMLSELRTILEQFDCDRACALLRRAVREYQPPDGMHDLVWQRSKAVSEARGPAVVVPLRAVVGAGTPGPELD